MLGSRKSDWDIFKGLAKKSQVRCPETHLPEPVPRNRLNTPGNTITPAENGPAGNQGVDQG